MSAQFCLLHSSKIVYWQTGEVLVWLLVGAPLIAGSDSGKLRTQ